MRENIAGVFTKKQLEATPGYRWNEIKGGNKALAVIECVEDIPCNPCQTACPFGAITVGEPITNLPTIDLEKCTGCGQCVTVCPGLSIFIINPDVGEGSATITFPYEYMNPPKKGDQVDATNRVGEIVCKAEVLKVTKPKSEKATLAITIKIPAEYVEDVRGIAFR